MIGGFVSDDMMSSEGFGEEEGRRVMKGHVKKKIAMVGIPGDCFGALKSVARIILVPKTTTSRH